MLANFRYIFVKKTNDGKSYIAMAAIDRFNQFSANRRQTKIQKIIMRTVQIINQSLYR